MGKLEIGGERWRNLRILMCSGGWGATCQNSPHLYEMENGLKYGQYEPQIQNGFFIALLCPHGRDLAVLPYYTVAPKLVLL